MRRLFLLPLLFLAVAAPARAAWTGPAPFAPADAQFPMVAAAGDDTRISAWTTNGSARLGGATGPFHLFAAVGDHPAVALGDSYTAPYVAAARGHTIIAWTGYDPHDAFVALPGADGTITPLRLDGYLVSGAAINDDGKAIVVAQGAQGSVLFVRAPGGDFGPPTPITGGATLLPTGEILQTAYTDGAATVSSAAGTTLTLPGATNLALAGDASGHVLAAWTDLDTSVVRTAIRTEDGTWSTPVSTGVVAAFMQKPALAVNARGDAVVGWQSNLGAANVVTGNLSDGALSAPTVVPGGSGLFTSAAIGADGSAVLVDGGQAVPLARRDGLGPFGGFETVDCYGGSYGSRALTIDDAGNTLLADGGGLLVGTPEVRTCDPITFTSAPSYSRRHVLAGVPVRVDAAGLRRHDADVSGARFAFGDDGATRPAGPTAVVHTFPRVGQQTWKVTTTQLPRYGNAQPVTLPDSVVVDVYARAALTASHVQRRSQVLAHGLLVHANAEASRVAAPVTITVSGAGRVLAHLHALLDSRPRRLRLPLAAVPGRVSVQLAQGGRVRVTRRIALR